MSIDYSSVGGIGICFDEVYPYVVEKGLFSEDDWEDDHEDCLDKSGLSYAYAGSAYSGDESIYLIVDGDTLGEVFKNAPAFIAKLHEVGMDISSDDLEVISKVYAH